MSFEEWKRVLRRILLKGGYDDSTLGQSSDLYVLFQNGHSPSSAAIELTHGEISIDLNEMAEERASNPYADMVPDRDKLRIVRKILHAAAWVLWVGAAIAVIAGSLGALDNARKSPALGGLVSSSDMAAASMWGGLTMAFGLAIIGALLMLLGEVAALIASTRRSD